MSTTLTNGLKLPDKGSVDWYADMQNNYQILDGAVGTVAEHTSALSGKAPLVHTHTKADITDLFNSANTWSALNTYSNGQIRIKSQSQEIGVTPSSGVIQYLEFADKNNAQHGIVGLWDYASGASEIQMYIADKFKNGQKDPTGTAVSTFLSFGFKTDGSKFLTFSGQVDNSVIPKSNNTYDLGSASYQWNNLYAKNYYYNGTAWGLDKENIWSTGNFFQKYICLNGDRNAFIAPMWEGASSGMAFLNSDVTKTFIFGQHTIGANNRYIVDNTKGRLIIRTGERNGETVIDFEPRASNATLGSSTFKWKTLNGINPGALSLPKVDGWNAGQDIDAAGIDTTNWDMSGGNWNELTNNVHDGWVYFAFINCSAGDRISVRYHGTDARYITLGFAALATGYMYCAFPLAKGFKANIAFVTSGTVMAKFIYPCIGNV